MRNVVLILLMSVAGAVGWWLGGLANLYVALIVSMIASGGALYYGRALVDEWMP